MTNAYLYKMGFLHSCMVSKDGVFVVSAWSLYLVFRSQHFSLTRVLRNPIEIPQANPINDDIKSLSFAVLHKHKLTTYNVIAR